MIMLKNLLNENNFRIVLITQKKCITLQFTKIVHKKKYQLMIRKLFLGMLLASGIGHTFAQESQIYKYVGVKAGLAMAEVTDVGGFKPGVVAGVDLTFIKPNNVGFSLGAFYTQQGSKCTLGNGIFGSQGGTLSNAYINFPLLAHYYFGYFALKAGIQPGFLVASNTSSDGKGTLVDIDTKDKFKDFDLAIPVGISYETRDFVFDMRYNFGLLNVNNDKKSNSYGYNAALHNNVFTITVGLKLEL